MTDDPKMIYTRWQRIKLRYAKHIDKGDKYCWAHLVSWALQYRYPFEVRWDHSRSVQDTLKDCLAQGCKDENPCYCGKFGATGPKPESFFETP